MNHVSMLNGFLDGLMNWFESLFSIIPKYFYFLITMVFNLLDILQLIMRKVAGLDSLYYTTNNTFLDAAGGQDMIMQIILNQVIQEAFIAMLLIGILMVFVFTIVAILRTEYNAEDARSASKSKIVGKSLRAVGIMFLIPSLTFIGLSLSNMVLRVLDSATMVPVTQLSSSASEVLQPGYNYQIFGVSITSTATPLSGMAFRSSAYKANRIRSDNAFAIDLALSGNAVDGPTFGGAFNPGADSSLDQTGRTRAANTVDDAFVNNYLVVDSNISLNARLDNGNSNYIKKYAMSVVIFTGLNDISLKSISKYNVNLVWFFYDLWAFDWVLAIGIIMVISVLLLNITLGLMKRVFDLIILFIVSPMIASTLPLDDGGMFKKWRQKFVGKALAAYAPIISINLFFMIVPFIRTISFFGKGTGSVYEPIVFADVLVQSFFVIVGLVAVKDVSKTISEMIGAEDAGEAGGKMSGEVVGTALKVAAVASGVGGLAGKAIGAGARTGHSAYKLGKAGVEGIQGSHIARQANRMEKRAQDKLTAGGGDVNDLRRGKKDVREQYKKDMEAVQLRRNESKAKLEEAGGSLKSSGSSIKKAGLHTLGALATPLTVPAKLIGSTFRGSALEKAAGETNKIKLGPQAIMANATFGIAQKLKDRKDHKALVKSKIVKERGDRAAKSKLDKEKK